MYGKLANIYDRFMMEDVDYCAYADWIKKILAESGMEKGQILEVGCGTGNMTLILHELGYTMTGLDLSGEMLTEADAKAFERKASIRWIQGDIAEMTFTPQFQAVVSTMDTFNYIVDEEDLLQAFEHIYKGLKPGGILLFDINTPYRLEKVYGSNTFHYIGDDVSYIWECFYDKEDALSHFDITFFVQEDRDLYTRFDECHVQKAHSIEDLKRLLTRAGFTRVECYDFLSDNPPEATSEKVHLAAQKNC